MDFDGMVYADQFAAGCLFGAQLVWTLAVIPTLRLLSPSEYLKSHTLLTWYGDALMPTLGLLTCALGYIRYNVSGHWSALVSALALTAASIYASRNLDINKRMRDIVSRGTPADGIAEELVGYRKKWAAQHFVRHVGGLVAFVTALIVPTQAAGFARDVVGPFGPFDLLLVVVLVMVGREIVGQVVMMRRKGPHAQMASALGID